MNTTTETKMLRKIQGKTTKVHLRNVIIREKAHIKPIITYLMKKRPPWFGHMQRRYYDNVAKSVLTIQIEGSRPRVSPTLRCMDRLKEDMKRNKIRPDSWFKMIVIVIVIVMIQNVIVMIQNVNRTQETTDWWETGERYFIVL